MLLCLSAFFSGTETAFFSLNPVQRSRLERLRGGAVALKLLGNPDRLLSAILVGNTFVNVMASMVGASIQNSLLPGGIGLASGVFVMTLVLLVFGEITPKVFAKANAVEMSRRISAPVSFVVTILTPFSWLLARISDASVRLAGGGGRNKPLSENEIISLLELGRDEGVLGPEARVTISLMKLGDSQCREAMLSRSEVTVLRAGWPRERMIEVVASTEYTRYPLLEGPGDRVAGFVDSRDLLARDLKTVPVRQIACFPENAPLDRVLDELRGSTDPLGAVFDEYGDWTGLVTVDDILEFAVFHSLSGSRDLPEGVTRRGRGFAVPGGLRLEKLELLTGIAPAARHAETCAGLVQELTGRIP
ncbi:HlyC/CorC family transporter, partial [Candidatus Fermentibacteria bacterium]|nr:HlyC/CorC family transporter [Candidatus Fermentibacteria bacterium]